MVAFFDISPELQCGIWLQHGCLDAILVTCCGGTVLPRLAAGCFLCAEKIATDGLHWYVAWSSLAACYMHAICRKLYCNFLSYSIPHGSSGGRRPNCAYQGAISGCFVQSTAICVGIAGIGRHCIFFAGCPDSDLARIGTQHAIQYVWLLDRHVAFCIGPCRRPRFKCCMA